MVPRRATRSALTFPRGLGSRRGNRRCSVSFQSWLLWPDNVGLSVLVFAVLAMAFLYAARKPMHELIRSIGQALGGPLRIGSRWLFAVAADMRTRNRAVLLAQGRQETGSRIEREF